MIRFMEGILLRKAAEDVARVFPKQDTPYILWAAVFGTDCWDIP